MQFSPNLARNDREPEITNIEQMLARGGNNFNFLRLMLASIVLFSHSFTKNAEPWFGLTHTLTLGEMAVNGFFLISGFLIVRSWQQDPRLWPYFKKRILRIYPAFLVASLLCLFVVGPIGAPATQYFAALPVVRSLKATLLLQMPLAPPVFGGNLLNGSMWTISYEFHCYVFAALIGVFIIKKPRTLIWLTIISMMLYPFRDSLKSVVFPGSWYLVGNLYHFVRFIMFFLVGGCFFLFLRRILFETKTALLCVPPLILCLCLSRVTAELAMATLGAYVLFWFAFLPIPRLDRFKHRDDVSYGLYLYGWPVQKLLMWFLPIASPWLLFPIAFVFSYGFGYLSWTLIEKPALRWKRKTPRDPRIIAA